MKNKKLRIIKNEKGAAVLLEQIFVVLFGILLLIMVVTVFTNLRTKSFDFVTGAQFSNIAGYVHNGAIIASQNMQISDSGKVFLDLPDKVGDRPYKVLISNNTINVTDLNGDISSSVQIFNVNSTISGNVSSGGGGRIFISYNKTANNITLESEERIIRG